MAAAEETAAEKAARLKTAGLQRELCQANIRVDGLTRELTNAEQRAKDAEDAKSRQVVLLLCEFYGSSTNSKESFLACVLFRIESQDYAISLLKACSVS